MTTIIFQAKIEAESGADSADTGLSPASLSGGKMELLKFLWSE